MNTLPETGYLRLSQIIPRREVSEAEAAANKEASRQARAAAKAFSKPCRPRKASPGLIPVSQTAWWDGVKSGRYPKPVKLGPKTTVWRVEDIRHLIENGVAP